MAWIYLACSTDSTSSQASVDFPLPLKSGQDPWPIVRPIDSAKASCCPGCGRVTLRVPQSGTMCERCIANHSEARSTLSGEDFLARISHSWGLALGSTVNDLAWSAKFSDSLAHLDPSTSSWKTSQQSLFGGWTDFVWSSLRWGTIVGGLLFQPQNLEPSTFENDGSFLPTPTACDYGKNAGRKSDGITPSGRDRWSLTARAGRGELPGHPKGSLHPEWIEQAMGYPVGWTDIMDLAMQWFRSKREKRS
jgi:hypothetical protein